MKKAFQGELDFGKPAAAGADGIAVWRQEREQHQLALARKAGLPIGQDVEVWLRGGVRLQGKLRLDQETLLHPDANEELHLRVGGTAFPAHEIESCVSI